MLRIRMGRTQRLTWLGLPRGDWRYKTRPGRGHSVYTTYCRQWKQNNWGAFWEVYKHNYLYHFICMRSHTGIVAPAILTDPSHWNRHYGALFGPLFTISEIYEVSKCDNMIQTHWYTPNSQKLCFVTLAFCRERHHHFRSGQASLSPSRMKMDRAILTTIAIQFNILSQTLFLLNIIVVGSARTYFRNQAGLQLSLSHSRCCHYNPFQDFPSIANQKSQLGILMSQALPLKGPYFRILIKILQVPFSVTPRSLK